MLVNAHSRTPGSLLACTYSDRSPPAAYSMLMARWFDVRNTSYMRAHQPVVIRAASPHPQGVAASVQSEQQALFVA